MRLFQPAARPAISALLWTVTRLLAVVLAVSVFGMHTSSPVGSLAVAGDPGARPHVAVLTDKCVGDQAVARTASPEPSPDGCLGACCGVSVCQATAETTQPASAGVDSDVAGWGAIATQEIVSDAPARMWPAPLPHRLIGLVVAKVTVARI